MVVENHGFVLHLWVITRAQYYGTIFVESLGGYRHNDRLRRLPCWVCHQYPEMWSLKVRMREYQRLTGATKHRCWESTPALLRRTIPVLR